ncbi:hypothetical protein [Priestia koreensis]|uniref:hypothetical protein n=1 Tax=Priestia koreensis TaxID=284581 RepID=UPI003457B53B
MEKQSVVLRLPKTLVDKVDEYKENKGFGTRTQTIFHLIQVALDHSTSRTIEIAKAIPCPKAIHPPLTHWASPFKFL